MISQRLRSWGRIFSIVTVPFLPQTMSAGTIHIGDIGNHPADQIKRFAPFSSYLAKQLKSEGIEQGKVVIARSIPEMATLLKQGKVDLFIDSAYPVLAVSGLSGSKFLLRRWKRGVAEFHALIFARKESDISRFEDLKGKMIAFEEPFSTATYFLPKLVLVQNGLKLVHKRSTSDPVFPDEVGYVFVGDDPNTMFWVLKEKVSAGVMNNHNYAKFARAHGGRLKIIHETFPISRQIVSYRADLNPKLVARIKEILVKMDQSEEGRKALKDFDGTTKFDEISDQAMLSLSRLQKFIDTELGIK